MNLQKSIKSAWVDFILCLIFGAYGVHKFREKKIGIGVLYLFTFGLFFFGWLYDCVKLLLIAIYITLQYTKTNDSSTEEQVELWNRYNALAKKIALIVVIVFLLFFFIVAACAPNTEPTAIPTTEPTSAPTTEPTTAPTTEPTTTPTTEPSTAPTTEPTTAPTTEPTTTPTTEPPHTHNFNPATCTTPKTCSCGATEGEANGHSWKEATYSSPKTCTVCGSTEGNPLDVPGKENYHGHVYTGGESSKKYHYESQCAGKNSHEITWEEVERRNLGPCGTCVLK